MCASACASIIPAAIRSRLPKATAGSALEFGSTMPPEPLRALVVDDERLARRALRTLLAAERHVEVVGEASRVDEAEELIRRERPGVVFLDVQLRGETGFDLLARNLGSFHTIFVTAFDTYAV